MSMQQTPWFLGFHDGFRLNERQKFEDEIDQEEYDVGYTEGLTEYTRAMETI